MAASRAAELERSTQHAPSSQDRENPTPSVLAGRRALRGLTHTGQQRALSPAGRFQARTRAHVRSQMPIMPVRTGYVPPGPQDQDALVLLGTEALSRVTQSLGAAHSAFKWVDQRALAAAMKEYGSRASLLGSKLPMLTNLAAVVSALVEAADALDRGDLRRATDVMSSGVLNGLLGLHPFTAVPAALLTASLGSDWPAKLIHHLAGTDEPEAVSGHAYLRTP